MTKHDRASIIRTRLNDAFNPAVLHVIDDSDKHVGHAGHQGGGRHFTIEIGSAELSSLTRVEAHRRIYAVLSDMMTHDVHALAIKIVNQS